MTSAAAIASAPSRIEIGRAWAKSSFDREIAPVQAGAEIAMREALQVDEELPPERQVEPVDVAQVLRDFRIERALGVERTAGSQPHQEESQRNDDQQGRRRGEDAGKRAPEHLARS